MRMNTFPKRQTMTFIVRVWAEYIENQPQSWRGEVESVTGGGKTHFANLTQMAAFIQAETRLFIKKGEE